VEVDLSVDICRRHEAQAEEILVLGDFVEREHLLANDLQVLDW